MAHTSPIELAKSLSDTDGNLHQFFGFPEALQIRIDALTKSRTFSPKKAIYIIDNVHPGAVKFPKDIAGQIFLQLKKKELTQREKVDLVAQFIGEDRLSVERAIALELLQNPSAIPSLIVSKDPEDNRRILENFELIVKSTGAITRVANPNWNHWLEKAVSVFALTIGDESNQSLDHLISITSKAIAESLELLNEQDGNNLCRQLAFAVFNHFPGDREHDLEQVIQLTENLGIKDARKNLLYQLVAKRPTDENIAMFVATFRNEQPGALAKFVLHELEVPPFTNSNGYLGHTLSAMLETDSLQNSFKLAIINELAKISQQHRVTEQSSPEQFKAIDNTIKGLIYSLVKKKQYPDSTELYIHVPTSTEIIEHLIESFKDDYLKEMVDSKLVTGQRAVNLIADHLGADTRLIDELTSRPNGIELLDSLREQRTGLPSQQTQLGTQRQGFQSDAGRAWSMR